MNIVNKLINTQRMLSDLLLNQEQTFASHTIPAPLDETRNAAQACYQALQRGNKIFFMGNGGSAAEAQHLAAELVGHFMSQSKPYAAIALNTDTSAITAIGNDYHFKEIFSRQLSALAQRGDVAIYFSTSGTSENIVEAMKIGKTLGCVNIAFTGMKTRHMQEHAHYYIAVPSTRTPQIQEGHLILGHLLCEYIEEKMEQLHVNSKDLPDLQSNTQ
jgi:D-sedoheptulose 7-phosphate isomerase